MCKCTYRDVGKPHPLAGLFVVPCLIVSNDSLLDVAVTLVLGPWLVAVALAARLGVFGNLAKVWLGTTEAKLGAADIQGTLLPSRLGITSTLGLGIAVGQTDIVGACSTCSACFGSVVALSSIPRTASTIPTWSPWTTSVVVRLGSSLSRDQ